VRTPIAPAVVRRGYPPGVRTSSFRLILSLLVASLLITFFAYVAIVDTSVRVVQIFDVAQEPALGADRVRLNGHVVQGSVKGDAAAPEGLRFALADNEGRAGRIEVLYHGSVPDAFRPCRTVLVDGTLKGGVFVARPDSLSTKCPSKYEASRESGAGC
jgi:cytochrome c-type biogenesis protein CcmE